MVPHLSATKDMSAFTNGEMVYVMLVMLVGAVVHSIIVSEVIRIITKLDNTTVFVDEHNNLVDSYVNHSEMDKDVCIYIYIYICDCIYIYIYV